MISNTNHWFWSKSSEDWSKIIDALTEVMVKENSTALSLQQPLQ